MHKSIIIQLFIVAFLIFEFASCNQNLVYKESVNFKDYKWNQSKAVIFEPTITDELIKRPLNLKLNIKFIQGFPYKFLHLRIFLTDPNGEKEYRDISIQIISDKSEYNGNGAGDYWDLDYVVDDQLIFKMQGKYRIEIKPFMEVDPINFMEEIELIIEKNN